jgi:hypothetical protein
MFTANEMMMRAVPITEGAWRKMGYVPFTFHADECWEEYAQMCLDHDAQFGWHLPESLQEDVC